MSSSPAKEETSLPRSPPEGFAEQTKVLFHLRGCQAPLQPPERWGRKGKDPREGTKWLLPADTEHTWPCWVSEGGQGPEGGSGKGLPCKADSPTPPKNG